MPLTKEQLLIPRYKVIATWPGMEAEPFRLNQIVTLSAHICDEGLEYIHIPINHMPGSYMRQGFFDKFPHLFQSSPWWSDREISDLPEYVKRSDGSVVRVLHYGYSEGEGELYLVMDDLEIPSYMDYLNPQPSNLEEYTAYINQKQQ